MMLEAKSIESNNKGVFHVSCTKDSTRNRVHSNFHTDVRKFRLMKCFFYYFGEFVQKFIPQSVSEKLFRNMHHQ